MIKKIIYLVEAPFSQRDFERFGVQVFLNKGFDVWIFDLSSLLYPEAAKNILATTSCKLNNLVKFNRKEDVVVALLKLSKDSFVLGFLSYGIKTVYIYRLITRKSFGFSLISAFPNFYDNACLVEKGLKFFLKRFSPEKIFNKIIMRIPPKYIGVSYAKCIFLGGAKSAVPSCLVSNRTKKPYIHTLDYDNYLQKKGSVNKEKNNYVVFLDQLLGNHPDRFFSKEKDIVTKEKYYKELRDYFSFIENKFSTSVVIAAHPRAQYNKSEENIFGNRKVVQNLTDELVKHAEFVILHFSYSVSYCVLYEKPFLVITTDELENSTHASFMKQLAGYFGKKVISISADTESTDYSNELRMPKDKYIKYKNDYIKMKGTEQHLFWDVASEYIRSLGADR